ncbi:MAG: hypothetical protein CSB01_01915 [Bacteroidia bacterium]|nr:MAG: hypothetical protein CSB01_01915 [Bacteroidia bacterium]
MEKLHFSNYPNAEKEILRYFSLLPAGKYEFSELYEMFGVKGNKSILIYSNKRFVSFILGFLKKLGLSSYEENEQFIKKRFLSLLNTLAAKNILTKESKTHGNPTFSLENVLAEILREKLEVTVKNCSVLLVYIKNKIKTIYGNSSGKIKKHITIAEFISNHIKGEDDNLRILNFILASRFREMADYKKSIHYSLKEIAICEHDKNVNYASLANSYYNLSLTYQKYGKMRKSLFFSEKALAIREMLLEKNHPWLANSYSNIASAYRDLGEYAQALEYSLKELQIKTAVLPKENVELGRAYKNLAITYFHLKNFDKANEFIEKSSRILLNLSSQENLFPKNTKEVKRNINAIFERWQKLVAKQAN